MTELLMLTPPEGLVLIGFACNFALMMIGAGVRMMWNPTEGKGDTGI